MLVSEGVATLKVTKVQHKDMEKAISRRGTSLVLVSVVHAIPHHTIGK